MENGLKRWMVGLLTALMLAWSSWVSAGIIQNAAGQEAGRAIEKEVGKRLDRIEDKLDRLLSRD